MEPEIFEVNIAEFTAIGNEIKNRNYDFLTHGFNDSSLDFIRKDVNYHVKLFGAKLHNHAARLAVLKHLEEPEKGIIGWYECDPSVYLSNAILLAAETELKKLNCSEIIGPMNGNTWLAYRFNTSSKAPLISSEPYQPIYYVDFWKTYGFNVLFTYFSEKANIRDFQPVNKASKENLLRNYNLTLKAFPREISSDYFKKLYDLYHKSFESNPLFKPLNYEYYLTFSKHAKKQLDEEFSFVVEDKNNSPIAVLLSYKGLSSIRDKVLIKTIAIHPSWQNKQLGSLLVEHTYQKAKSQNIFEIYHLLMYASNLSSAKGKIMYDTTVHTTYELLQKQIS